MKKLYVILSLVTLIIFACGETSEVADTSVNDTPTATASESEASAKFVANPIRGEKVEVKTLEIGAPMPSFRLPEADGGFVSSDEYKNAKALVVIFTCNHCPTAQAYEDRMVSLANDYKSKGVEVVAISPNSPIGLLYEELGYTDLNDDFDQMAQRKEDRNFPFPYLYDGDNQQVSLAFGAVATPHVFVFDESQQLRYVGRMDKNEKPGTGNSEDVRVALDAILSGKPVENATTKTFGCSTKWSWKDEYRTK